MRFVHFLRNGVLMNPKYTSENYVNLQNSFSVNYAESASAPNRNLHIHSSYELNLILSDGVVLDVNDESYAVPCGSLLLFNTMDLHRVRYYGEGLYKRWICLFDQGELNALGKMIYKLLRCFFARSSDKPNLLVLSPEMTERLKESYANLKKNINRHNSTLYPELKCVSLAQFLVEINDLYFSAEIEGNSAKNKEYSAVYEAILYIQANIESKIKRSELAKNSGMDERTLCDSFKSVTGFTTAQYILNFRLTVARSLLAQGLPVTEVCEKTGFDNWSNFSRTFKAHVGISPKKYQMQHTN